MYCRFCGKEVEENMNFCPYCGRDRRTPPDGYAANAASAYSPAPAQPLKPLNGVGLAGMIMAIIGWGVAFIPIIGLVYCFATLIVSAIGVSRFSRCRCSGFSIAGLLLGLADLIPASIMLCVILAH